MRKQFSKTIIELAEKDPSVVLITGDFGYGVIDDFKNRFPERYFNMGICEQAMISVAAGMALEGLKPYVYTITPFLIERPFEQIKIDIDQQCTNVTLVGYANYPAQGPTHAALNAPELIKLFKNIRAYFPANSDETHNVLVEAYKSRYPTFISLKKDAL